LLNETDAEIGTRENEKRRDTSLKGIMRPSWHEYFMLIAKLVSTSSTCNSRPMGAVLVKDKQILATGYMPGAPHCLGKFMEDGSPYCHRRALHIADVFRRCFMKPWFMVFLMFLSGGYLFADVAFLAAQEARDTGPSQNILLAERQLVPKNIGEQGALPEKAAMPLRLAQNEPKPPERPILRLRPDAGTILKSRVQPPPPPDPWYSNPTVIVAIISTLGAVIVAIIGLVRRGRSD
jgi:hypothetical protein